MSIGDDQRKTVLIDGYWYDVTNFNHPGGPILDEFVGLDATVAFKLFHSLASDRPYAVLERLPRTAGPPPEMPLSKLGGEFYQELSVEVKKRLPSKSLIRSSQGFVLEVWLLNYLLILLALALTPGWFSRILLFVTVAVLPRAAEFCAHEASHFRFGRHSRWNSIAMLAANVSLHLPAPTYRAVHNQEHHIYTNAALSGNCLGGPDSEFVDQLTTVPSGAAMVAFPPLRVLYNLAFWFISPNVYVAAKMIMLAHCTFVNCFFDGWTSMWRYCIAAYGVSASSALLLWGAASVGGWNIAEAILIASIARGTVGFLTYFFLSLVTHLSVPIMRSPDPGSDHVLRQLTMSNDFATGSMFVSYFTNCLNNQVTHHLFPQLPWQDTLKVVHVVEQVAAKHKLSYSSFPSYITAAASAIEAGDMVTQEQLPRGGWWALLRTHLYGFEWEQYSLS